jgi:hypothetical protein
LVGSSRARADRSAALHSYRRIARISSLIFARTTSMSANVDGSLVKAASIVATAFVFAEVPAMACPKLEDEYFMKYRPAL